MVTPRPPIRLPEPGSTCIAVTPPANAVAKPGSCGQSACSAQTLGVVGSTISLPSLCASAPGLAYTPRCECTSMMPGVIHLPAASTTVAPSGACRPRPTAATRPSASSTSASSRRSPVPVSTVAWRNSTGGAAMRW